MSRSGVAAVGEGMTAVIVVHADAAGAAAGATVVVGAAAGGATMDAAVAAGGTEEAGATDEGVGATVVAGAAAGAGGATIAAEAAALLKVEAGSTATRWRFAGCRSSVSARDARGGEERLSWRIVGGPCGGGGGGRRGSRGGGEIRMPWRMLLRSPKLILLNISSSSASGGVNTLGDFGISSGQTFLDTRDPMGFVFAFI